MKRSICLVLALLAAMVAAAEPQQITDGEVSQGWQLLFDGQTTQGWRNYQRDTISDGWQVVDGALTRVADAGDIVTVEQYSDFELRLEWKVAPGGNSGIFFRAGEGEPVIYMTAPEVQVLDDERHQDGASPLTSAGSCYGLYPAPRGIVKPAETWNQVRLLVEGDQVSQWLNGQLIASYEIGSPEWQERVRNSKFAAWPAFGTLERGHIGVQDHGDRVAFRDIRIKVLDVQ
jgi:hypothetical protein